MKKIALLTALILLFQCASAQLHFSAYGGYAIKAGSSCFTPHLDNGMTYGLQLSYRIPAVKGLGLMMDASILKSTQSSVPESFAAGDTSLYAGSYRFTPFLFGVYYLWQFAPSCGLSTHAAIGFNHRSISFAAADGLTGIDHGTTFAYRLGLDFIIVEHMSVGFRFLGLGNTAQDNKVATPFDRQQAAEDHFGQNFFTIVLGLHI